MEYTMQEMQSLIKTFVKVQRPLMMWGPPGIGKSDSVREVAKAVAAERGKTFTEGLLWIRYKGTEVEAAELQVERKDPKTHFFFIDVRLSQMDPSDLRGIPFPDRNVTRWLPPNWLPQLGEGILFFDEINLAAPSIQSSFYQLVLDRRLGDYCLPDGWTIVAAGNRLQDSANVFAMAKPLHNRFAHGELIPPPFDPDWREWALAHGVHIDVVAFVGSNLQWLYKNDPKSTDPAFPTHRSWALAGQVLSSKGLEPTTDEAINEMYKLVGACVGQGAASYFKGFLKVRKTIKIEDLLKNPEKVKTLKENEVLYALSSGLASKYGADRKLMTPVLAVLGHMEADDMAVFTLRLMRGVQATNFSTDLTGSPLWPKLSGRFGKFLL